MDRKTLSETTFAPDETWAPAAHSGAPDCCKDYNNLVTTLRNEALQVRECRVCLRKHYRGFAPLSGLIQVTGGN